MSPLRVAFLWHQHQPLYKNPRNGRYSLPWVRLHALKDYYDMAALAGEFPRLRVTFNLVPSLLDQIDDYAFGAAIDPALDLARRPAQDLDEPERLAVLDLFFSVPHRTLIAPYPRYASLYHKRGSKGVVGDYRDALSRFKAHDLRDLQVWFHLAWCGSTLRARPEIRELFRKAEAFTEDDKAVLLNSQNEFLRDVIPIHRKLQDEGIAEISTSPYYHPILPLLCDIGSAREAIHDLPLPPAAFRRPGDAARQMNDAVEAMRARFGSRPAGVWPSEGSLSVETLRILGECGARWTASDESVLRSSWEGGPAPEIVDRPYVVEAAGEAAPEVFFRDQKLSDLVGFTYSAWRPDEAAADMIARLRDLGQRSPGGVVSVILDGENAWEHYPDNGARFLRALYAGLTQTPDIQTVTFSGALDAGPPAGRLARLRAGSWIGASFTTWIGHPEKNRAWSLLASARQEADAVLGEGWLKEAGGDGRSRQAWRALAAAEGSDWFWWLGDDHASEQDAVFDSTFRDLLRGVYETLGRPVPGELDLPIKRVSVPPFAPPAGPISPVLDGRVTDYFEWLPSGVCESTTGLGTMHEAPGLIRRVAFGTDGRALFVRVDPGGGDFKRLLAPLSAGRLAVHLTAPSLERVVFQSDGSVVSHGDSTIPSRFAADDVLEVEIPLPPGWDRAEFFVALSSGDSLLQRLPRDGSLTVSRDVQPDWSV